LTTKFAAKGAGLQRVKELAGLFDGLKLLMPADLGLAEV
jgi:hypothetical protein